MMQNRENYIEVLCEVNGAPANLYVSPDRTVVDVLRNELGLTGTKQGCDDGNCGACTILVDGKAAKSCSMLIGQARNKKITTIEGVSNGDVLHPMQQAFIDHFAIQCGFCTPGMIMTAIAILNENPNATEEDIREGLHGNLCRCTGYVKVVEAIEDARDKINAGGVN
ncbi:(2Fe-2S)-binding protein [Acetobacterium wieringae]|uniref:(2Fe-2S)-binding protein n=1 Tax=Acetobacterium wieringae TaxID=52694 RepID=UPI002B1FA308|nr:(2Fe-2S)-binding protein [Acetobacterium wieringae]MEA4807243.1 (2Fe-2S)-binding protein [Acetobacterium wieringae]